MPGSYGTTRRIFIAICVLFVGMIIGGGAHIVASIISHAGKVVFHSPAVTLGFAAGVAVGLWMGGDRAIHRFGEHEKEELRHDISVGGKHINK